MRTAATRFSTTALALALAACATTSRRVRGDEGGDTGCGTSELSGFASEVGVMAAEPLPDRETVERDEEIARLEVPCGAAEAPEDCRARVRSDALTVARETGGVRWTVEVDVDDGGVVAEFRVGRETLEGRFASFEEIAARMRAEQARGIDVYLVRAERIVRAGRATAVATRPVQEQRDVGAGTQLRWRASRSAPGLPELARAARAAGLVLRSYDDENGQRTAVVRCASR
ncbi:MAG: hypothetical protein IT379_15920 [Deltaproteobacteria bacterium]|nr:hypothetical protein [Deltaproteobacteria bacterium]